MTDLPAEGAPGDLDGPLRDLLDDQRRLEAADRRRRSHWLGQAAGEAGGLAGILVDLGERGRPIALGLGGGRRVAGTVVAVGPDVVEVAPSSGPRAVVALAAVETVRPEPGAPSSVGDRAVVAGASLRELLADRADGRPEVVLHTRSGEGFAGQLRTVGVDVVTLWLPVDRSSVHVALEAVAVVRWA